jgi:REP element-mobilizing transposase RayT
MSATIESKAAPRTPGHAALRKGRVSIPGQAYLLTAVTLYRRPVFRDPAAAFVVSRVHNTPWLWRDSKLLAWVLMPDHWHGLVVLGKQDDLHSLVGRFKAVTARLVEDRFKVNGCLWSRGFQDRALRDDESLRTTARYLIANPLRAGLVDNVGNYPFWNAVWLDQDVTSVG